jgi:NADPH2:quinone reductase
VPMKAAWYEHQGAAREVLVVGDMPTPQPGPGEVRIRMKASGINPGDIRKREDAFGYGMPYQRIVPHSDGSGIVDGVGEGVSPTRMGERVWCFGAQSYRPFGTAAQWTTVPQTMVHRLDDAISFEAGACLGIPGITAHRAVHAGGDVAGKTVLVQGGAGGVGTFALGLAKQAGARVLTTVRSPKDMALALRSGADHVTCTEGLSNEELVAHVRRLAPAGIDHVVEVDFGANIDVDVALLRNGGSIGAFATRDARPAIPFWELLFKNVHLHLLGSDDFSMPQKLAAAQALSELMQTGWSGLTIERKFALEDIADAHEHVQQKRGAGRSVIVLPD